MMYRHRDFSGAGLINHFRHRQSGSRRPDSNDAGSIRCPVRRFELPRGREFGPRRRVGHQLIAGKEIGQGAHIAGALHIVLPAKRIHSAARDSHISQKHLQIAQCQHVENAGRMLRDAHGPDDCHRPIARQNFRRLVQLLDRHAGYLRHAFRRVRLQGSAELLESFAPLIDKRLVVPAVRQNDLHDAIDQSHIRSRTLFQVKRGKLRDVDLAGICDNQRDPALEDRLSELGSEDRMLLGCVRADDEQGLSIASHVVHGVAHRP